VLTASAIVPVPAVLSTRCHYCSKFRNPHEIIPIGTGGALMCFHCYEWHTKSLNALATGSAPPGCFECRVTWAELRARPASGDETSVKMYLVPKDGIYQLLCRTCSDAYERKRADLLGDTVYGHLNKLKGAK
jgi:hypothetical protein